MSSLPLKFLLLTVAGWMNRDERAVIEYLLAEISVLREHTGGKRLRYTDAQRARLGRAARNVKPGLLRQVASLATPRTLLDWWRRLVAAKYDGSSRRGPGRPRTHADIVALVLRMARDNSGWGYTRICGALCAMDFFSVEVLADARWPGALPGAVRDRLGEPASGDLRPELRRGRRVDAADGAQPDGCVGGFSAWQATPDRRP